MTETSVADPELYIGEAGQNHDYFTDVAERVPAAKLKELSKLNEWMSVRAIAEEWLGIFAAIWLCERFWHPALYVLAVIWIGSRLHTFVALGHEGVHYRLFNNRNVNEWVSDLFLWWPTFTTTQRFRMHHWTHHRFLGGEKDGNRVLWRTHYPDGRQRPEWVYPKTPIQLFLKLAWRACGITGVAVVLVGFFHMFWARDWKYVLARLAYYAAIFAVIDHFGVWREFGLYWMVPLCTTSVLFNFMRLITEHSMVTRGKGEVNRVTRTTIPTWFDLVFISPRYIGYHIEHHSYPSIPWYNLPKMHEVLKAQPGFERRAHVTHGVFRAIGECLKTPAAATADDAGESALARS